VLTVAAQVARAVGNERRADSFEKAATAPAMTTVAGWAAEPAGAAVPGFILSISRRSAFAGILARSPAVVTRHRP
jgi:hypothetical protein